MSITLYKEKYNKLKIYKSFASSFSQNLYEDLTCLLSTPWINQHHAPLH